MNRQSLPSRYLLHLHEKVANVSMPMTSIIIVHMTRLLSLLRLHEPWTLAKPWFKLISIAKSIEKSKRNRKIKERIKSKTGNAGVGLGAVPAAMSIWPTFTYNIHRSIQCWLLHFGRLGGPPSISFFALLILPLSVSHSLSFFCTAGSETHKIHVGCVCVCVYWFLHGHYTFWMNQIETSRLQPTHTHTHTCVIGAVAATQRRCCWYTYTYFISQW